MSGFWAKRRLRRAPIGVYLAAMFGVCLISLGAIIGFSGRSAFVREQARASEQVNSMAQFAAAV